jgi:recombinational DNA repair ATPase RecF
MRIKKATLKNYKCHTDLEIVPDGAHILLIGDNEVGKSSLIDAILRACGKPGRPVSPIKTGSDYAEIQIETTDGIKSTVRYRKNGDAEFEIITRDGIKDTRKSTIVQLLGGAECDIESFARMSNTAEGRRNLINYIKRCLPQEIIEEYDAMTRDIAGIEELRKNRKKDAAQIRAIMDDLKIEQYDLDKYLERIPMEEMVKNVAFANEVNNKRALAVAYLNDAETQKKERLAEIERLKQKIKEEEQAILKIEDGVAKTKVFLQKYPEDLKVSEISVEMQNAELHNSRCADVEKYNEKSKEYETISEEIKQLDTDITKKRVEKRDLIAKSDQIPVEGLWFDDEQAYINEIPLTEESLSTSQVMEIGIKLTMALNPKTKIITIPRGESLGKRRLKTIFEIAEKYGYQIIMEQVERGLDELKIIYTEDITKQ